MTNTNEEVKPTHIQVEYTVAMADILFKAHTLGEEYNSSEFRDYMEGKIAYEASPLAFDDGIDLDDYEIEELEDTLTGYGDYVEYRTVFVSSSYKEGDKVIWKEYTIT